MKFIELHDLWRPTKEMYVKASTMGAYDLCLRNRILPKLGDTEIEDINTRVLQAFLNEMLSNGLSSKSAQDVMIVVKMILRYGAELELIPFKKFRLQFPTKNMDATRRIETYSDAEQKKIANYVFDNPSFRNIGVLLTLCTGMRIGEVCALKWGAVDLENRVIKIRSTMSRIYTPSPDGHKTQVVFGKPKTIDSNRDIPIARNLLPILKKYKAISRDDYFVTSGGPSPIEPRVYRTYYKDLIINKIGMERCIKFHGMRHTFATRLVENGAETTAVSKILGHSDVSITMNLYVHPTMEKKSDSVNRALKGVL